MQSKTSVIKCTCGADMVFDPDKRSLVCPYCGNTQDVKRNSTRKRDYYKERSLGEVYEDSNVYDCPNCGAEVDMPRFDTTVKCPFCGGTNIVQKESIVGIKPNGILPFLLSQSMAAKAGQEWIRKKLFAPSKAKKNFSADHFNGVYFPSFNFTTDTKSVYSGRLGEYYYETVGSGENEKVVRRTEWFYVRGTHNAVFRDMIVESSKQLVQAEVNKILPYDTECIEEYKREYVAGFTAERYDTSLDDSFDVAKQQISALIKKQILSGYSYDVVDYLNINTEYPTVAFDYTLLPIWICGYKYGKKSYRFIVNGRNGKSWGKYPKSPIRVLLAVLIGIGIIALLVLLALYGQ